MKQWIAGGTVTVMFGMAAVSAAVPDAQQTDPARQAVTIRGCVVAGTEPDTFLLTNVTEVPPGKLQEQPVPKDTKGRDVLYWLSSTRGLKKEIGQRVEVNGTIEPDKPKEGKTTVAEDPSKRRDLTNKIASGGRSVKAKTDSQPESDPATKADTLVKSSDKETERVVYRLKVSSLRSVGTCR
jgi:hypothetical protein